MLIFVRESILLEAIDTSMKEKNIAYLVGIYECIIKKQGGLQNVTAIVPHNAPNYKGERNAIKAKHVEITWVPCTSHTLNLLLLKDFGKMTLIK